MTCFLLRYRRRHNVNASLLLCGHKFSEFCTLRAVMVRYSAGWRKQSRAGLNSASWTFSLCVRAICFCLLVYFNAYLDPKSKTDILNVCPIMSVLHVAVLCFHFEMKSALFPVLINELFSHVDGWELVALTIKSLFSFDLFILINFKSAINVKCQPFRKKSLKSAEPFGSVTLNSV